MSLLLVPSFLLFGCGTSEPEREVTSGSAGKESTTALWRRTAGAYLQEKLWCDSSTDSEGRDLAYDAGHHLMIPLHAAFVLERRDWQEQIANLWLRFVSANPAEFASGRLDRLQFLYLASRFVVLALRYGRPELIPDGLVDAVTTEVARLWTGEPAWQWGREPFPDGIQQRLRWKLDTPITNPEYLRAIIDEELHLIGIAADLSSYFRISGEVSEHQETLDEILDTAFRVFTQEVQWFGTGQGWLLQPGIWSDHPDYAYAGWYEKQADLAPAPVPGIASDSSHSHRLALWLGSLELASHPRPEHSAWYRDLQVGLDAQFRKVILVPPDGGFPAFRLTNYMDGNNGLYRWGYQTQGIDNGYGPSELSGTLALGWWSFLRSESVRILYAWESDHFPLPDDVIKVYVGPNTTRPRHALVTLPAFYCDGFAELLARLASQVAHSPL